MPDEQLRPHIESHVCKSTPFSPVQATNSVTLSDGADLFAASGSSESAVPAPSEAHEEASAPRQYEQTHSTRAPRHHNPNILRKQILKS